MQMAFAIGVGSDKFDLKYSSKQTEFFKNSDEIFFLKRKKFDNVTTTASMGFSMISAFLSMLFFIAYLVFSKIYISHVNYISHISGVLCLLFLFVFLAGNMHFYRLSVKEKGILFLAYTAVVSYVLALVVSSGVLVSALGYPFDKITGAEK